MSPHLDDAVLSVGATIRRLTRGGADVVIATVFAGDPEAATPASYWDATRGEMTQGAAVRVRRREDEAAGRELGATTVALPWPDSGYVGARDPDAIWSQLCEVVAPADVVLLPGWPLSHADHRYATLLTLERGRGSLPVVFYAEQPYAAEPITLLKGWLRNRTVAPIRHACGGEIRWRRQRVDRDARRAQDRALTCYGGEVANLGVRGRWGRLVRRVSGAELLGVGPKSRVPSELQLQ